MTCTRCNAAMPVESPDQLCPRCLLQAALASGSPPTAVHAGGFAAPSVDDLRHLFPSLEVIELLGKGGMGAVYKAKQIALDRLVALKILPAGDDPAFAERFVREARALARLSHPNIVGVHDFGRSGNQVYFLMEFVDGVNLRQAMRAGELGPAEALKIVPQICDALQFAHDEGIVHRDIKPENILLDKKGRVKIADFGLAKILGAAAPDTSLTGTRQGMGTFHYMAPEQLEAAKNVDHRADIYSLGVTFYEMLTGELPLGRFAAPSHKAAIDVRLDDVVFRSLEKEPGNRYQQASEVKLEVETISRTSPPEKLGAKDAVQTHLTTQTTETAADSNPFIDAMTSRPSVWMKVPWIVRAIVKTVLTLTSPLLMLAFLSFTAHSEVGANAEKISTFSIGMPDRWFEWTSHPNGFSHKIYPLRWSVAAGILAGVFFWLLIVVDRIERRARQPNLAAAVVAEAREIGGYLLGSGIVYLLSGIVAIVVMNTMESPLDNKLDNPETRQLFQRMQILTAVWMTAGFVVGLLQIVSSMKLAKLEDGFIHRLTALAGIVMPTPLWLFGLMLGIWVLRFLRRPEVRAALESRETSLGEARAVRPRESAPGWAYVFGWLSGCVIRFVIAGRAIILVVALLGIFLCLMPWMAMWPAVSGSRGSSIPQQFLIPGAAYIANWIVLASWVGMAFVTVMMWPLREPSRLRAVAIAILAATVGISSLTLLTHPHAPNRADVYLRIMDEVRMRAPEMILEDATDLEIIERGIRQRKIILRVEPMAPPSTELVLAVMCLLFAALELQRAWANRPAVREGV